jgi:hypothetical protein
VAAIRPSFDPMTMPGTPEAMTMRFSPAACTVEKFICSSVFPMTVTSAPSSRTTVLNALSTPL